MRSKRAESREHGVKNAREQGTRESNIGSREQRNLGIVSNNVTNSQDFLSLLGLFYPFAIWR